MARFKLFALDNEGRRVSYFKGRSMNRFHNSEKEIMQKKSIMERKYPELNWRVKKI